MKLRNNLITLKSLDEVNHLLSNFLQKNLNVKYSSIEFQNLDDTKNIPIIHFFQNSKESFFVNDLLFIEENKNYYHGDIELI